LYSNNNASASEELPERIDKDGCLPWNVTPSGADQRKLILKTKREIMGSMELAKLVEILQSPQASF
jgi:hypothetical protein